MPKEKQKPDFTKFTAAVGKTFATRHEKGLNSNTSFAVAEFLESKYFDGLGKKPAFKLHRVNSPGVHYAPAEQFFAEHDEVVKEPADTEVQS